MSRQAMTAALGQLCVPPDYLLIDALHLDVLIERKSLIKGDTRPVSIAAASILAKTHRGARLEEWDAVCPQYGLARLFAGGPGKIHDDDRAGGIRGRLGVELVPDGGEGAEELVGDVSEDGGAAGGDAILGQEEKETGEEFVDVLGRGEFGQVLGKGLGDSSGFGGLLLLAAVVGAVGGVGGGEGAATAPGSVAVGAAGEVRNSVGLSGSSGHGFPRIQERPEEPPPVFLQECENKGDVEKRVRKSMKTKELENGEERRNGGRKVLRRGGERAERRRSRGIVALRCYLVNNYYLLVLVSNAERWYFRIGSNKIKVPTLAKPEGGPQIRPSALRLSHPRGSSAPRRRKNEDSRPGAIVGAGGEDGGDRAAAVKRNARATRQQQFFVVQVHSTREKGEESATVENPHAQRRRMGDPAAPAARPKSASLLRSSSV